MAYACYAKSVPYSFHRSNKNSYTYISLWPVCSQTSIIGSADVPEHGEDVSGAG